MFQTATDAEINQRRHATVRDLWDARDWESTKASNVRLQEATARLADTSWTAPEALADVHQLLTRAAPDMNEALDPAFRINGRVVAEMRDSDAVAQMREHTLGDPTMAGMAATMIAEKLADLFTEVRDIQPKADEADKAEGDYQAACDEAGVESRSPEAEADEALEELRQHADAALAEVDAALDQVAPIIGQAARAAAADGEEAVGQVMAAAAGWDLSPAQMSKGDPAARLALAARLTGPRMLRMADLIGRLRTELWAEASAGWRPGHDEAADVTYGDDIGLMLSDELVYLATEATRPLWAEKYASGKLLQLQLRERNKEARGRIIYAEDASTSMLDQLGGQASIFARALGIVLLEAAIAQKRGFLALVWSGSGEMAEFDFGADASTSTLEQRLDYAEFVMSGGTEPMQALSRCRAIMQEEFDDAGRTQADVVVATDGLWEVPEDFLAEWRAGKAALGFRSFGIAMNHRMFPGLADISDLATEAPKLVSGVEVADIFRSVVEPAREYA